MATYYVELGGGNITPTTKLTGGSIAPSVQFTGGDIYPTGGGGGANLTTKTVSYTPTESAISDTQNPPTGYDGFSQFTVDVGAISSTYVGSDIPLYDEDDVETIITDTGLFQANKVEVPAGYYADAVSKTAFSNATFSSASSASINGSGDISVTFPAASAGMAYTNKSYTVTKNSAVMPRTSSDLSVSVDNSTVQVPNGYYAAAASKTIPNCSTPQFSGATVNNDGTVVVDFDIATGGYIASTSTTVNGGTVAVQAAQTITPTTTNQTIAADQYLTGAQTILGDADLVAGNIKKDVSIFGVTGTYEGGGGGISLDDVFNHTISGDVVVNVTNPISIGNSTYQYYIGIFAKNKISSFKSTGILAVPPQMFNMSGTTNNLANRPLVSVEMDATHCGNQAFMNCSNLVSVKFPQLTTGYYNYGSISTSMFENCTSLVTVAFPKLTRIEGSFLKGCTHLTGVDFGALNTFNNQFQFQNDALLTTVILRNSSVASLANISTFSGTPFASGGSGGTLYVPNSLISSYQGASNWSTILGYANNSIVAIEGSAYENTYIDGTPIS